ncbi:pirin family protein [Paludibaculum fermentans]|uniref:pirin family protein n=1 Tax=Paludibaculum fermentans TaxID=1473598 RepID=UPI003EBD14DD
MSDLLPAESTAQECAAADPARVLETYPAHETDLGRIRIRRILPVRQRRLIGPWCFLDRYGPLSFTNEKPMDVAPHPHIGLQTVSWLLSGEIVHHDSLGTEALLRPGQLGVMTAGGGITHTEETPVENSGQLSGVQLWVALPEAQRNGPPAFGHHPAPPVLEEPGALIRVILGDWMGRRSDGAAYSPMVGAQLTLHAGTSTALPLRPEYEHGLVVLSGDAVFEGQEMQPDTLYYLGALRGEMQLTTRAGAQILLIGGAPFGETILMWWNFVARTQEEIAAARSDWEQHLRFDDVRAYQGARLRAPQLIGRPIVR